MKTAIIILLLAFAAFNLWLALRGHRRGRATLSIRGVPPFESDREDDPVGFQVAILIHAATGLLILVVALGLAVYAR
jgi:hypothetical protein